MRRMRPRSARRAGAAPALALMLALATPLALAGGPAAAGPRTPGDAYAAYARGDYMAAGALLAPLAWQGDARAQALLGFLYEYGKGVPQNVAVAAQWYITAAEQGEPSAQYLLGLLYDKGHGVPRDVVLAQKWLILAAAGASRRERNTYTRIRDAIASKMSVAQLALAQQMAIAFVPVPRLVPQ
ncbi:tetratricopeptide repeat protein [Xanthobacter sp. AM11]|uniref:tetratricopeptide repeat protein n=1 Tax=Xanthobacter sp. AM11 TaxID=3380643 RepID=UPI0039BEF159